VYAVGSDTVVYGARIVSQQQISRTRRDGVQGARTRRVAPLWAKPSLRRHEAFQLFEPVEDQVQLIPSFLLAALDHQKVLAVRRHVIRFIRKCWPSGATSYVVAIAAIVAPEI